MAYESSYFDIDFFNCANKSSLPVVTAILPTNSSAILLSILDIVLPDKKQLLLNVCDLKSKELIIVNNLGFNNGRLIVLNSSIEKF